MLIFVTHCCQSKTGVKKGTPRELWIDTPTQHRLRTFWREVDEFKSLIEAGTLKAGILSLKYGIAFHDEEIENYDIDPSQVSKGDRQKLGRLICEKINPLNNFSEEVWIIYYGYPPSAVGPFAYILANSGIPFTVIPSLVNMPRAIREYGIGWRDELLQYREYYKKRATKTGKKKKDKPMLTEWL